MRLPLTAAIVALSACTSAARSKPSTATSASASTSTAASAGAKAADSSVTRPTRSSASVLTAADIKAAGGEGTIADLIRHLRPNWFRGKGGELPAIFINGVFRSDGIDVLRSTHVSQVIEARYYSIVEGRVQFGTEYRSGVIAVKAQ